MAPLQGADFCLPEPRASFPCFAHWASQGHSTRGYDFLGPLGLNVQANLASKGESLAVHECINIKANYPD